MSWASFISISHSFYNIIMYMCMTIDHVCSPAYRNDRLSWTSCCRSWWRVWDSQWVWVHSIRIKSYCFMPIPQVSVLSYVCLVNLKILFSVWTTSLPFVSCLYLKSPYCLVSATSLYYLMPVLQVSLLSNAGLVLSCAIILNGENEYSLALEKPLVNLPYSDFSQ